jgi:hypothetical protein
MGQDEIGGFHAIITSPCYLIFIVNWNMTYNPVSTAFPKCSRHDGQRKLRQLAW